LKNRFLANQAVSKKQADLQNQIAELVPQLNEALKANGIDQLPTWHCSTDMKYMIQLNAENAAKLLAILNAGVAQ